MVSLINVLAAMFVLRHVPDSLRFGLWICSESPRKLSKTKEESRSLLADICCFWRKFLQAAARCWLAARARNILRPNRNACTGKTTGSHCLAMEVGRHHNIRREFRKCRLCNEIEDERHFLFDCPVYDVLRQKYRPLFDSAQRSVSSFIRQDCSVVACYLSESMSMKKTVDLCWFEVDI